MWIFRQYVTEIQASFKFDKNNGYSTWKLMYIYNNISLNFSYNQKYFKQKLQCKSKHISCSITFSPKSCPLRDHVQKYGKARQSTNDNIMRCMRCLCWTSTATDTRSGYVILIAFPRQKQIREGAYMLCYTYIACRVFLVYHLFVSKMS